MTAKPPRFHPAARRDIETISAYYRSEAGPPTAIGFADALERALAHISAHPATGSPRYAHALDLPGLRVWPLRRFPHLVFYIEHADHIDVWRILHGRCDIPESFKE